MIDATAYSIEIRQGNFDGEVCFQARVKELPYLEEYAGTFEEAYALVIDSIETTAALMAEKKKPMPAPIEVSNSFSGRVTLRLPKTLHGYLSARAESEDVSLNTLLISILSDFRGFDVAHEAASKGYQMIAERYERMLGVGAPRVVSRTNLSVVGKQHYQNQKAANAA